MIKFDISKYIYEHEKQPRGVGHWAFYTFINDTTLTLENYPYEHYKEGRYTLVWTSKVMSLTEAKKELKEWLIAHSHNNELIYVAD